MRDFIEKVKILAQLARKHELKPTLDRLLDEKYEHENDQVPVPVKQ